MTSLTQEFIKRFFYYDPDTGIIIRLNKNSSNAVEGYPQVDGTIAVVIDDEWVNVDRLAWLYVKGYIPKKIVHVNGIISDNRWKNLVGW